MTSRDLIKSYGRKYGFSLEHLRYARNCGYIKFTIRREFDPSKKINTCHFEYEMDDVDDYINNYWLVKGLRWRRK